MTPDSTFNATSFRLMLSFLPAEYKPDIVTHHLYSLGAGVSSACGRNALRPNKLNNIATLAAQVNQTVKLASPTTDVWVGEWHLLLLLMLFVSMLVVL